MKIKTFSLGEFGANCYIVTDDDNVTAVIDPGQESEELFAELEKYNVKYILLTHGHFDHIMGACAVKEKTNAPVYIHPADEKMLSDSVLSLAEACGAGEQRSVCADVLIQDGDIIDFAGGTQVLHTPGHTPGSVCYKTGNIIFTGDTIFCRTVGRTDFPGGSMEDMIKSVDRLQALPGDYILYPGHNRSTTMEDERNHNRYIRKKNAYLKNKS